MPRACPCWGLKRSPMPRCAKRWTSSTTCSTAATTFARPAVSGAEENLLNLRGDRYAKENILVHEFGHTFHEMGLNSIDRGFDQKLQEAYAAAKKKGLWKGHYAQTNHKEYWAEGVQ